MLNLDQDRLREWLDFRAAFLDETLRHDGLAEFLGYEKCSKCGVQDGIIKCRDCSSGRMLKCKTCILSIHQDLPLHRVEVRRVQTT
jgi:hypothetical protein